MARKLLRTLLEVAVWLHLERRSSLRGPRNCCNYYAAVGPIDVRAIHACRLHDRVGQLFCSAMFAMGDRMNESRKWLVIALWAFGANIGVGCGGGANDGADSHHAGSGSGGEQRAAGASTIGGSAGRGGQVGQIGG